MKTPVVLTVAVLVLLGICVKAGAMGEESFGNRPLFEANYKDWPDLMPLINHPSRVYHYWVNGHEGFFYRGGVEELNECLLRFSQGGNEVCEVVIRPGPAEAQSFHGKSVPYNWDLEILGGISSGDLGEDLGDTIWSPHPILTVHVDDAEELEQMNFPEKLQLLELADMKERYARGLKSRAQGIRGVGTSRLANLDPYDEDSVALISELLKDEVQWVRSCAVGAMQIFGRRAQSVIPALEAYRAAIYAEVPNQPWKKREKSERLMKRIDETIQAIKGSEPQVAKEQRHKAMMAEIHDFLQGKNASPTRSAAQLQEKR